MLPCGESVAHQEGETVDVLQRDGGAFRHGVKRIVRHVHREFGLVLDALVQPAQLGPASGEVDARLEDVGRQLGWRVLQRAVDAFLNLGDALVERARDLKPSPRGELEITDLNRIYLEKGDLNVELLGRGTAWLDTGTHKNLMEAGQFVQVIEERQGLKMACLEGIGYENGWLSRAQLEERIQFLGKTSYATYLRQLLK